MALDKIKTDVIADANVTIAKLASNTGVKSDRHSIPALTTTQRDAMSSPQPGDLIYNSREIFPGPLWVIGSDHSEGCGLIVADESGIEIIPYRYGVLWPSQRLS